MSAAKTVGARDRVRDADDADMSNPKSRASHSEASFSIRNATDDDSDDARGPGSISRRVDDDRGIGDVERGVSGDDDAPDER